MKLSQHGPAAYNSHAASVVDVMPTRHARGLQVWTLKQRKPKNQEGLVLHGSPLPRGHGSRGTIFVPSSRFGVAGKRLLGVPIMLSLFLLKMGPVLKSMPSSIRPDSCKAPCQHNKIFVCVDRACKVALVLGLRLQLHYGGPRAQGSGKTHPSTSTSTTHV